VISVVLLGDRTPTAVTHRALDELAARLAPDVELRWCGTDAVDACDLDSVDGVWVGPGTPYADEAAVLAILATRRERGLPTLGTCGGFQHMVVEFARAVAGVAGAAHEETDPAATDVVVAALECRLVGEVRQVTCVPGTRMAGICGVEPFPGFHYCGYGVNPARQGDLEAAGLVLSAYAPDAGVEAIELPMHPFYVGTLFQPQMTVLDGGPVHPLVTAFVDACRRTG
jgi:CTP synthase (UTP-ammonia lyase)